jgi:hypothetical protein
LCGRFRKYVLVVDYLPIGGQLASLCKSLSHCLESLELWHQWGRWLGKTPSFQSENIFEFWDGTKMRAYQAFWEPKVSSYLDIKTNQKSNEMTYSTYHSRVAFTTIYKQLQVDEDGLFPPQCAIHDLHRYLMTSTQR